MSKVKSSIVLSFFCTVAAQSSNPLIQLEPLPTPGFSQVGLLIWLGHHRLLGQLGQFDGRGRLGQLGWLGYTSSIGFRSTSSAGSIDPCAAASSGGSAGEAGWLGQLLPIGRRLDRPLWLAHLARLARPAR